MVERCNAIVEHFFRFPVWNVTEGSVTKSCTHRVAVAISKVVCKVEYDVILYDARMILTYSAWVFCVSECDEGRRI